MVNKFKPAYVYTVKRGRRDVRLREFVRRHHLRPGDRIKLINFYDYCHLMAKAEK